MEAGHGAQQQVERLEAAVEEARRKLAHAEQQLYAWRQGAEGERRTAGALLALQHAGWEVLHDVHWPGRPKANIDHIAVGPTGIFVIDSKHWSGEVSVRAGVLRQNGSRRAAECEGVAAAAAAVAALLEPQHRTLVLGLLCLVAHPTPTEQPQAARVTGLDDLATTLSAGTVCLSPTDITVISDYLRQQLDGSRSPEQRTTALLEAAGPAPRPASRPRRRSARPAPRRTSVTRRRSRSRGRRSPVTALLKIAAALVLAFVLVPAWLHHMTDSAADPGSSVPGVQQQTEPSKAPHGKKPAAKTSPTSRASARR